MEQFNINMMGKSNRAFCVIASIVNKLKVVSQAGIVQLISGQDQLKEYLHTPNKARVFCQNCGSPIYSYRTDLPNIIRLRLGSVTEGKLPAPKEEFFTEHKPNFVELR